MHGPRGGFGPWWAEALDGRLDPIAEFIERDRDPSRHAEVSEATWEGAGAILPGAHELAGTFAEKSGPNCFGTVMAAAGAEGATATAWSSGRPANPAGG
ncbi:hypothetical protein [Flexivirga caeni]|uniref:Uncharacterized protein n=1 Tax=Flexivirga caeni TaxID=2294115 RepID=A0A3M9ME99_9MICO|nr:hypothetical protein [Flexivirga caeni]RNI23163.1 hypothetical protein EFY87_06905 [Flexivirga caeni]